MPSPSWSPPAPSCCPSSLKCRSCHLSSRPPITPVARPGRWIHIASTDIQGNTYTDAYFFCSFICLYEQLRWRRLIVFHTALDQTRLRTALMPQPLQIKDDPFFMCECLKQTSIQRDVDRGT